MFDSLQDAKFAIVLEEDLDISIDFFRYISTTEDKSVIYDVLDGNTDAIFRSVKSDLILLICSSQLSGVKYNIYIYYFYT